MQTGVVSKSTRKLFPSARKGGPLLSTAKLKLLFVTSSILSVWLYNEVEVPASCRSSSSDFSIGPSFMSLGHMGAAGRVNLKWPPGWCVRSNEGTGEDL